MTDEQLSVTFAGKHRWRPPKVELRFDVVVRNPDAGSRWAVLADSLPSEVAIDEPCPIRIIDQYELTGTGRVVVARFLGTPGFYAFTVPAASEVRLERVPVSLLGDIPRAVDVTLFLPDAVVVGNGVPAAEYFPVPLTTEPGAVVDASPLANQRSVMATTGGPDDSAFAVTVTGGRALHQRVRLGPA